jgi:CBS domain containing-hemolysin-like protein
MLLFGILISLILSALFSGSEIAFVSANKLGIEVLKNKSSRRGQILSALYERPRDFIGTMLVGNNICLVIFTILMTSLLEPAVGSILGERPFVTSLGITVLITIVVLIFGEFLPKTIFRLYSNEILYRLSYPLSFFKTLLQIPAWMMTSLSSLLIRKLLGLSMEETQDSLTKLDLEHYINDTITEEEAIDKEILTNALNLNQVRVRDCMVPRTEVVAIDKTSTIDEAIEAFKESRLSRLVVVDGDIDEVIGYVHHQQLLTNPKSLKRLPIAMIFVPEAMNAQDLLLRFIKDNVGIACVVDEFGGTAGLITLEDILEEIFGEIEDEHDDESHIEQHIGDNEYLFSGRLEIDYLNEKYDHLDLPQGEYQTLSGYIVMTSGEIPDEGQSMEKDGYSFVLEKVSNTKIDLVRVIRLETEV